MKIWVRDSSIKIAPAGVGIPVKKSMLLDSSCFDFSCKTLKRASLKQENIIKIKVAKMPMIGTASDKDEE